MLWAELLQDDVGHAAIPGPQQARRVLPTASAARSHRGRLPKPFCVQVRGPHSSCFSSKPHVHLKSRRLGLLWSTALPRKRDASGPSRARPPEGTWARHSRLSRLTGLELCVPRCWMRLLWRCLCGKERKAASGADPGPRGRGPGQAALNRNSPSAALERQRASLCPLSKEKARGTASGWVVGGESGRDSRSEQTSKRQRVLPVPNGKSARTNTRGRAPPQPNIVTWAQRRKDRQKFRAETRGRGDALGPRQRPR